MLNCENCRSYKTVPAREAVQDRSIGQNQLDVWLHPHSALQLLTSRNLVKQVQTRTSSQIAFPSLPHYAILIMNPLTRLSIYGPKTRIMNHANATRCTLHNSELFNPVYTLIIPMLNTSPSAPQPSPPSWRSHLPPLLPGPPTLYIPPSYPLLPHIPPYPSLALDRTVIRNSISRLSSVVDTE